jgi:hypothetical protein
LNKNSENNSNFSSNDHDEDGKSMTSNNLSGILKSLD